MSLKIIAGMIFIKIESFIAINLDFMIFPKVVRNVAVQQHTAGANGAT